MHHTKLQFPHRNILNSLLLPTFRLQRKRETVLSKYRCGSMDLLNWGGGGVGCVYQGRVHSHLMCDKQHPHFFAFVSKRQAWFLRTLVQKGDHTYNRRKQDYNLLLRRNLSLLHKNMRHALFTNFQFTTTLKAHWSCLYDAVNIKLRAYCNKNKIFLTGTTSIIDLAQGHFKTV